MTEAKHTPGPWFYGDWIKNRHGEPSAAGWVEVWNIKADGFKGLPFVACKHHDEIANARLIAAAPELLEALILMVRTHEEPAETLLQEARELQWIEKARSAIAKATGN